LGQDGFYLNPGANVAHLFSMTSLQFPIGKFEKKAALTAAGRVEAIDVIAATPGNLRAAIAGLTPDQLDTPYRPEGWTVRQVVHHVPDSHLNAYIRTKLALTESEPTIKPYKEDLWAKLEDSRSTPIEVSLNLLDAVHHRWVLLLRSLAPADFARAFRHPEMGLMDLDTQVQLYDWHGRHHVAHITSLRKRMGW
jgi:DinB superfamily